MRKFLAAFAALTALAAGAAHAENVTHCQAGAAHAAKKEWAAGRTEIKLCLAQGALSPHNAAAAHLNLSGIAYEERKWPEVISEYDLAAKAGGKEFKPNAAALFFKGLAYAQMNETAKARAVLDQTLALAPTEPRVLLAHMDVALAQGQPDVALADGAKLAASDKKDVQVLGHMRRAVIFEGRKRNDDAMKEIDAAAKIDPQNLEIVEARMNLYAAQNQVDKAMAESKKLIASPMQKWALAGRMARAEMLQAQKRPDDALAELSAALKLAPGEPNILLTRAALYAETGKTDQALADSAVLIASKDKRIVIAGHAFRGVLYDRQRRYDEGLTEADAILKLDPSDTLGLNNRCVALANLGRSAEALATCQKALAGAPKSTKVQNSMGYALEKAGKLKEAVGYYQKVAAAAPQDMGNQGDLKRAQAALAAH